MLSAEVAPKMVTSGPNTDSRPAMQRSSAMSIPEARKYTMLTPGLAALSWVASSADFW